MNCNCNQPKKCCGPVPARTCCSGSNAVSKSDFYDYKNNMETDLYNINRDLASKELKLNELEIEDTKLDSSKQNKLVAGNNIILTENADKTTTITAVGSAGAYYAGDGINIDTANNEISVNDTIQRTLTAGSGIDLTSNNISVDNTIQRALIAGNNITIDPVTNTISAADGGETYTAGPGIVISSTNEISTIMQQSNYYDKTEINQLIADLDSISMEVVATLPSTGLSNVIYLVERTGTTIYDQWVYSSGQWHNVGDTNIDLNDYYTKTETYGKTEVYNKTETDTLLNGKQNTVTGSASTVVSNTLTSGKVVTTDAAGKITNSPVNVTELGYLEGLTKSLALTEAVDANAFAYNSSRSAGLKITQDYETTVKRRTWKQGNICNLSFHCKGDVDGSYNANWTTLGQVPSGFRPKYKTPIVAMVYDGVNGNDAAGGYIGTDGYIVIWTNNKLATNNYQVRVNATYLLA